MHPDYKDVIKTPMDLATLHSRASSQMYSSYEEFIRDCTLIFDNCATYNQPSSQIVHMSKTLRGCDFINIQNSPFLLFIVWNKSFIV